MYRARQQNVESSCNEMEGDDIILQFNSEDFSLPAVPYKQPASIQAWYDAELTNHNILVA